MSDEVAAFRLAFFARRFGTGSSVRVLAFGGSRRAMSMNSYRYTFRSQDMVGVIAVGRVKVAVIM